MKIGIFTGGNSSEAGISMKSAAMMKQWLTKAGHSCSIIEVNGADWMVHGEKGSRKMDLNSFDFDFAWNMIHGTPGEDGKLQGYFDMMGIPYSGSGHMSSALTFNKYACKTHLKQHQILTAEAALIRKDLPADLEELSEDLGFPCFVKPNNGGSSFGIAKVSRREDLEKAIDNALKEDREVLVERYVKGTEVTCGLYRANGKFTVFPITEIVSHNEFFDYEAKYQGKSEEITPARIEEGLSKKCQELSRRIYELCDSAGLIRVDFIIKGNQVYFLELNSIPGMSGESIIPQQVAAAGMKMEDVLQEILMDALNQEGPR